jgi:L-asparaginase
MNANILILYAGGTIGMWEDPATGTLIPLDLKDLNKYLPEIQGLNVRYEGISLKKAIDSAELTPNVWTELVEIIEENYTSFDGFVILHGTDTMAYTSSALSFMIQGLNKPIILTGSQLPLGRLRTDGRENFITAIEIASIRKNDEPLVQEVAICFGERLMRGNRSWKANTEIFDAFDSPNYGSLAAIGTHIIFNEQILFRSNRPLTFTKEMTEGVGVLKLYPGILPSSIAYALARPNMKVCIIESFGAGNVPRNEEFLNVFKEAVDRGVSIINISQCRRGRVDERLYKTGKAFAEVGAIFGNDLTFEAAITKSMFLLAKGLSGDEFRKALLENIAGELSEN